MKDAEWCHRVAAFVLFLKLRFICRNNHLEVWNLLSICTDEEIVSEPLALWKNSREERSQT